MLDPGVRRALDEARERKEAGEPAAALVIYKAAWEAALQRRDHAHASVIAHIAAVAATDPAERLQWDLDALREADTAGAHPLVVEFYPSLYNNLAYSYMHLGRRDEALRYALMAAERLADLKPGPYADRAKASVEAHLAKLRDQER